MGSVFCFVEDLVKALDVILDGGFGKDFAYIPQASQCVLMYFFVGSLLVFDKHSYVERLLLLHKRYYQIGDKAFIGLGSDDYYRIVLVLL